MLVIRMNLIRVRIKTTIIDATEIKCLLWYGNLKRIKETDPHPLGRRKRGIECLQYRGEVKGIEKIK